MDALEKNEYGTNVLKVINNAERMILKQSRMSEECFKTINED